MKKKELSVESNNNLLGNEFRNISNLDIISDRSLRIYYSTDVFCNCIYFLIKNDIVVYVGQTTKGICRISNHYDNKDFDTIKMLPCKKEDLNDLEILYITKYQPLYNSILSNATTLNVVKNELINKYNKRIGMKYIRNMACEIGINFMQFKGNSYISKSDSDILLNALLEKKEIVL